MPPRSLTILKYPTSPLPSAPNAETGPLYGMVWPILISVDVTPRISAVEATAGHVSTASALSAPNPMARRIMSLPFFDALKQRTPRQARLSGSCRKRTCHDTGMDANHNHYESDTESRPPKSSGIQSRFATTAFDINDRTPFRWKGT